MCNMPTIPPKSGTPVRKPIKPPVRKPSTRASSASSAARAPTTATTTPSQDSCTYTDSEARSRLVTRDFSPSYPRRGEKPNELLQRLYSLWPTDSYRPHAVGNPQATAKFNLRYLRQLFPRRRRRRPDAKAAGVVVEAVIHLDRKAHLSLATWPRQ